MATPSGEVVMMKRVRRHHVATYSDINTLLEPTVTTSALVPASGQRQTYTIGSDPNVDIS